MSSGDPPPPSWINHLLPPPPTWLDRLRSNKGFPQTEHLTLDEFLRSQNPNSPNTSQSHSIPNQNRGQNQWKFSSMKSILAELFVMEIKSDSSSIRCKKNPRKQPNPRHFKIPEAEEKEREEVKEGARLDLVVIDTSGEVWKTEKVVRRRGEEWSVRERKKVRNLKLRRLKKKRKFRKIDDDESDDYDDEEMISRRKMKKMKKKKRKVVSVNSDVFRSCLDYDKSCTEHMKLM